jgi:hypothetical protein
MTPLNVKKVMDFDKCTVLFELEAPTRRSLKIQIM